MSDSLPSAVAAHCKQHLQSEPKTRRRRRCPQIIPTSAVELDQFYTRPSVAARLYGVFCSRYNPDDYLMVEPSAGTGSFSDILPIGSLAFDCEPKARGIIEANFLTTVLPVGRPITVIGNPPFGKNSCIAVRFFNHAAMWESVRVIAFIVPRTFRKASIVNRLDSYFHLVHEVDVEANAFLFSSDIRDVPTVFQIWERKAHRRTPRKVKTKHVNFRFTTADGADFAIQRIGGAAGRVHKDFGASESSNYFISGPVERAMKLLEPSLRRAAADTAGFPSLAKSEIIALYEEHTDNQSET